MNKTTHVSWREALIGLVALVLLLAVCLAAAYGLSRVFTGTVGGAVAGGLVAIAVSVFSKAFEHYKQQQSAIAEKKRDVYRRLLAPWERLMVNIKAGKEGDDVTANLGLAAIYASAFDAVLYGSEAVVQRYVDFRSPDPSRDSLDMLRALAALLVAMREDVTGKKTKLPVEAVLGTIVNFSEEELLLLRMREYVAAQPEAKRQLAQAVAGKAAPTSSGDTGKAG